MGYSCLTIIDDKYIGILYEGDGDLYFQKIPIKEFIK
jgi:exo-alpha-sialidase